MDLLPCFALSGVVSGPSHLPLSAHHVQMLWVWVLLVRAMPALQLPAALGQTALWRSPAFGPSSQ